MSRLLALIGVTVLTAVLAVAATGCDVHQTAAAASPIPATSPTLATSQMSATSQMPAASASPARSPTTNTSPTPTAPSNPMLDSARNESLRRLADRSGLRIGTAVDTDQLADNVRYRTITAQQFSTVTPENDFKWDAVEPFRGTYNWTAADQLVAFAQAHQQLVRGHTLVWYKRIPAWLSADQPTAATLRALLKKHITDEVSHFRGKVWQWDVVNEAFNDDGTLRNDIWLKELGPGYIADAFRWAHEADPHALLFYNDYDIEGLGAKLDAVYAMVRQLQAGGIPISGVGLQTHLDTQSGFPDQMQHNLQRFAALGLKVAETEVDVRMQLPIDVTQQLAQTAYYSRSLQACLAVRQCISYTVWGFGDAYSWVRLTLPGEGSADLYDTTLRPKAAYYRLKQNLQSAPAGSAR